MNDFIVDAVEGAGLSLQTNPMKPDQYLCEMVSEHSKMVREINVKPGYGAPKIGNLVYHFALAAQNLDQYDDILDWAKGNDMDLNDPKTIPRFTQLVDDKRDLRLLLSEPVFQKMMTGLEISQAIANAVPR